MVISQEFGSVMLPNSLLHRMMFKWNAVSPKGRLQTDLTTISSDLHRCCLIM